METTLTNFIKYCLGYIKITRQKSYATQHKLSVEVGKEYFDLIGLLNGETDDELGEEVKLEQFYNLDPGEVTEKDKEKYEKQKNIAQKIEHIYNDYKNDQYRKHTVLNFGFFEVEIPVEDEFLEIDVEDKQEHDEANPIKTKTDRYPMFSIPVHIEKEGGKYVLYFADPEIQVEIGMLEQLLGNELYFQFLREIGELELSGKLTIPITEDKGLTDIWNKLKNKLRLTEANFDDSSFDLHEMRIALRPRANFFLADDLRKLSEISNEDLGDSALTSWVSDDELEIEDSVPAEKELYFPFQYDKFQLQVLSLIKNKASIVQGPPGTGKSETIANLLCHLAATGKKVLFVSQKAQALKVVKDKLKRLDISYLFGYLPNPFSAQIGEEDEFDGIAPQLSALDSYVEQQFGIKFNARQRLLQYTEVEEEENISLVSAIKQKGDNIRLFNKSMEVQRNVAKLHDEYQNISEYDLPIQFNKFETNFSFKEWGGLKKLQNKISKLNNEIERFKDSKELKLCDKNFKGIDIAKQQIFESLSSIIKDYESTGYDGHSGFFRNISNTWRNFRLQDLRTKIPRELRDFIDSRLSKDISKNQMIKLLRILLSCIAHKLSIKDLSASKKVFLKKMTDMGINEQQLLKLHNLVPASKKKDFDLAKTNILKLFSIRKELKTLSKYYKHDPNQISELIKKAEKDKSKRIGKYLQNIINNNLRQQMTDIKIRRIAKTLAKAFGKSKKAFKTFDKLRKEPDNFKAMLNMTPIWIMELDDASRIIPLEPGIFDYVILDEASQCNVAYTLPSMFRANRALFVGDSEQMRDNTIIFKSNRTFDDLAHRYKIPDELKIKATGEGVQSVLDMADLRGFKSIALRNHYRSPKELIGFSNEYFYKPKGKELIPLNNDYISYQNTNRVMLVHKVESDWAEEFSDRVNVAEAKAILKFFKDLREDPTYKDKSVGILTFFNDQATLIRELFETAGFKEDEHNYKISIIEGIQGDEKDIILYSFVIRTPDQKNKYVPLTGERGDIRADINKGRVNVAFSRARLQTHSFISMELADVPENIWIKKYLEYVMDNGEIDFYSKDLKPFDSNFEKEFYAFARSKLNANYKIFNQVPSSGFKIDFSINNTRTGKKIAVECDGPTHFKDEIDDELGIYIQDDEERQGILESAGWTFYRVKYSDWINKTFDRKSIVPAMKLLLE